MSKRSVLLLCIGVLIVAFLLQAMWESPLRPTISWLTAPGCRLAWAIAEPKDSKNFSVWRFDLIAIAVNGFVYGAILYIGIALVSRRKITG